MPLAEHALAREATDDRNTHQLVALERCLERLPPATRALLLRYYGTTRGAERQHIADELGITVNALRIRMHRVRTELAQRLTP